jgi:hypothetical protein
MDNIHTDADYIFVASIRTRKGKRIFARHYGLKAFRLKVRKKKQQLKLL